MTATYEPGRSHWWQLTVFAALLIVGLLGMHALASGPMAASAQTSMTSSGHASPASPGMSEAAAPASVPMTSGSHGVVHGTGGCADAMSSGGGSTCVSVPTGKSISALPTSPPASLPEPVPAAWTTPPPETPRRFALSHLELSIYRT
ncbi:hypothetical protein ACQBAU_01995 [Propionibacteriaceae bacterium Y2011]